MITPLKAKQLLDTTGPFKMDGMEVIANDDGSPCVMKDGEFHMVVTGEIGDTVTADTGWMKQEDI